VGTSPAFNQKDLSFIPQLPSFHNAATVIIHYFHKLADRTSEETEAGFLASVVKRTETPAIGSGRFHRYTSNDLDLPWRYFAPCHYEDVYSYRRTHSCPVLAGGKPELIRAIRGDEAGHADRPLRRA
jgi:hypothetical protein